LETTDADRIACERKIMLFSKDSRRVLTTNTAINHATDLNWNSRIWT
jgi:hypothetical protein